MKKNTLKKSVGLLLISCVFFLGCEPDVSEKPALEFGIVTDHQGNQYKTVKIGDQWWMAENLRATTLRDSTPIQYISIADSNDFWATANSPVITNINNSLNGVLYNGYILDSDPGIAPEGWHIATENDWITLESHIGMTTEEINSFGFRGANSVNDLVAKYSVGWPSDILLFGTDQYGFNAKPSGCRISDGRTNISSNTAFWWVDAEGTSDGNLYRYIDANQLGIFRQYLKKNYGMSIRCVKN
jgi:uncharacterized protein (TIGR02145 family)